MFSRLLIIACLLGASIGVPYLASRSPLGASGTSSGGPAAATNPPSATQPTSTPGAFASTQLSPAAVPLPPGSSRFPAIEQVLRFDVTKEWVYRNWSRKSTGPTDVGLFGVRVPLVTGTHPSALAGSLTYFFNAHSQVEHISFHGRTGDTTPLVGFLMRTYEFRQSDAPVGEQVYRVMRGRRIQSELRSRPESVLRSNLPQANVDVELELARPNSKRFLPPHGPTLQIPQVATSPSPTPPTSPTASDNGGAAAKSGIGSYLDKFRYATPQEEDQVLWKRWPN